MAPHPAHTLQILCTTLALLLALCVGGSQPAVQSIDTQPSLATRNLRQSCLQLTIFWRFHSAEAICVVGLTSIFSELISFANAGGANICPNISCISGFDVYVDEALASSTFDILAGFNTDYLGPVWGDNTSANVAAALFAGTVSKLMVYDSYADSDVKVPGIPLGVVARDVLSFPYNNVIEPVRPGMPTSTGPAGEIGPFQGCPSSVGSISTAFIDADHIAYYQHQDSKKPSDVEYCFGKGRVFYSTNPVFNYIRFYRAPIGLKCDGGASPNLFANTLAFLAGRTCASAPVCPTAVFNRSWVPPNNKFIDISLWRVPTDVDNNIISVDALGCSSSDPSNHRFGPDCILKMNGTVSVRAKREGKYDGRLYRIDYLAKDATGLNCTGQVFVCIPHNDVNAQSSNFENVKAACPDVSAVTFVDVTT